MYLTDNINNEKSEFSELGAGKVLHVKKIPSKHNDSVNKQSKTIEHSMNIEENSSLDGIQVDLTNQYLKFVNDHLVERLNLVEKMIDMKYSLEREIELLQSNDLTKLIRMPNMQINNLSINEINEVDTYMKLQRELTKSKIDYYKNKIENVETEFQEKQLEINDIERKHKSKSTLQENLFTESDDIVKEELKSLIKKYGMKELTYAVDIITSSKIINNNRNLE